MDKKFTVILSVASFFVIVSSGYGAEEAQKEVSASKIIPSGDHNEKAADVLMDETTKAAAEKSSTTSRIIPSGDYAQKKEPKIDEKGVPAAAKKENTLPNPPGNVTKTESTVRSVQKQTAVTTTKTTTTTTAKEAAAQPKP
ncbi:MAG TPA: hypothetical protein PL155_00740 [Candidatus Omnitrophota bacterium]|nr:hypothetical protein [Candidatus Omnitrophota bacterium]HPD84986.1 hypothetical protein [Candidatus Omnitrophota bacterium]HRZ03844.1 hypothetical protein [Candidatus Omnitrophota bacterium]